MQTSQLPAYILNWWHRPQDQAYIWNQEKEVSVLDIFSFDLLYSEYLLHGAWALFLFLGPLTRHVSLFMFTQLFHRSQLGSV